MPAELDLENVFSDAHPDTSPDTTTTRASYAWALDCDWVWQNLGGKMTKREAGTSARWALWQFAKRDMDKFVQQIMPKAMLLLERALEKTEDGEEAVAKEKKSISELESILVAAVKESQSS